MVGGALRSEPGPIRKALAGITLAVVLFAAVIVQLTMVNRLPLPGTAAPDLVLLLATAIAVTTAPAMAAITGFAGGLALDVAPPAAHYVGEYALIFCLVCYAASRVYRAIITAAGEHDALAAFTIMAVATATGEAGKAALGRLLEEPDVTTAAVIRVLPGAILYDLLLSPFAFLLVAWIARGTVFWKAGPERAPAREFSHRQRLASVFRQASAGAVPGLRLAGSGAAHGTQSPASPLPNLHLAGSLARARKSYVSRPVAGRVPKLRLAGSGAAYATQSPARRHLKLRLAGTGRRYVSRPVAGRVPRLRLAGSLARARKSRAGQSVAGRAPRLRLAGSGKSYVTQPVAGRVPKLPLSDARSSSIRKTTAAFSSSSQFPLAAGRRKKLNFGGDLPARSPRTVRTPGKNWLRSATSPAMAVAKRPARGPAHGWLGSPGAGGLVNGRTAAGFAGSGRKGARPRRFTSGSLGAARAGTSSIAPRLPRSADEALAARSAPSGLSALAGAGTPLVGGQSPQPGWLSGGRKAATRSVLRTPHSGWLGSARGRPRTVIGSTVGGRTVLGAGPGMRKGAFRRQRAAASGHWHTASPSASSARLRRDRHPWHKRSRRLLRMIGVGQ